MSQAEQEKPDYNKLFQELQTYNANSVIMLHVPSLGESVAFKPLSVKQQTNIITGVLQADQSDNIYDYQNTIDRLLVDNCDPDKLNQLMVLDRTCLLIQLRLHTMGDTIQIDGETHDLKQHVDTFAEHVISDDIFEKQMSYEGIQVTCQCPTLLVDHKVNESVPSIYKNTKDKESVSDIFLIELAKFIAYVNFSGNQIDFSDLTMVQRIKICEILPMVLSQKIVEYIEQVRQQEQPYITLPGDIEIPIDSQLFNR